MSLNFLKPDDLPALIWGLDHGKVLSNKFKLENRPEGVKKLILDHVGPKWESYVKKHNVEIIAKKAIDCCIQKIEFYENALKDEKKNTFNHEGMLDFAADIEELQKIYNIINTNKQDEFINSEKIKLLFISPDNNIEDQWKLLDLQRTTEKHFKKFTSLHQEAEQPTRKKFCEFIEKNIQEKKVDFKDMVYSIKKDYEGYAHFLLCSSRYAKNVTLRFLQTLSKQDFNVRAIDLEKHFDEDIKIISAKVKKISVEAGIQYY